MKISSSLLKPNVNLLQEEYLKLKSQTGFGRSAETATLRAFIDIQLEELDKLLESVSFLDKNHESRVPDQVYFTFKRAKHNLRISARTWSRIISNEARIRKMQEKRRDIATFAA
jgi:hypothetical protein